jgi:hypothetical protein
MIPGALFLQTMIENQWSSDKGFPKRSINIECFFLINSWRRSLFSVKADEEGQPLSGLPLES